ncbi:ABC transporter ATP-binding protein [Spirochaeta cellobiosiphila]|uniref:ABC transporter ATP-binding protein n=1 Tax=Spirochaeta cellobiosiphila TaxID=504483 RepID=UPI00040B3892|nr:ABC transporter ATP-binding protein [Spirochaeta cellobiosiphila]
MIKRLLSYFKESKWPIVGMYIFSFIFAGASVLVPYLTKIMMDRYIIPKQFDGMFFMAALIMGDLVLMYFSGRWQGILVSKISYQFLSSLRKDLYVKLQKLPIPYFDKNKTGETISIVTNDVQVLEQLLQGGLAGLFVNIFLLIGILIMMLFIDLRLSSILLITVPLFILLVVVVKEKMLAVARSSQKELGHVNGFLNESISGMKVIRSFSKEKENIKEFHDRNEQYYSITRRFIPLNSFFWQSVTTINLGSQTLVLLFGGLLLWKGWTTIGIITAFMGYIVQFFNPIQQISNLINEFSRSIASCERIFGIIDQDEEIYATPEQDREVPLQAHKMAFKDLHFEYKSNEPILKGISFESLRGTTTAIVGHTGSGKSTMMNLLCRFYAPQGGQILMDNKDISQMGLKEYRQMISIVMQEPILFTGDVAANLQLGNDLNLERIKTKMSELGLSDIVDKLPHGYQTKAGARGNNLSLGERQLLSLGRALVKEPQVLILDEATAYIDTLTEEIIQQALSVQKEDRFTFVIAHRLSTIKGADNILVLDDGKIVESGNHQELLAQNGHYAGLVNSQFS